MLPKLSSTHSQERRGINAVQAYAADNNQIWRETEIADVGIDGHLEYVDPAGFVSGRLVGLQVKCGPSYFKSPTKGGWKFSPEDKHRVYWERYPLPVMLVMHDPAANKSYWMDARQALRSPATAELDYLLVPDTQVLQATPPLAFFHNAGVQSEQVIESIDDLVAALVTRRSTNGSFPVSFLDLFAGGLTNICRSLYFGTDVGINAAEANLHLAGWEVGHGIEHDFLFDFVRFLVSQHLAEVNFSDCLIDWTDRDMLPHFVAPLTARGRALVDALQEAEAKLVAAGKMEDGEGRLVAQEGFFGMTIESYFRRLPRIYAFQKAFTVP